LNLIILVLLLSDVQWTVDNTRVSWESFAIRGISEVGV
jgi:hypothetical protein